MSSTSTAVFNANIPNHVIDYDTHETIIDHIDCDTHETIIDVLDCDTCETILDYMDRMILFLSRFYLDFRNMYTV